MKRTDDAARLRRPQRLGRERCNGRFRSDGGLPILQPACEPVVNQQPVRVRQGMRQRRIRPADLVAMAKHSIDTLQLAVFLPGILNVVGRVGSEVVAIARPDEQRLGREGIEQIPTVQAERAAADQILLCIVGSAGRQKRVSSDVFKVAHADRGSSQAIIHGRQQHCQGCAAGVADRSDSRRIDFWT